MKTLSIILLALAGLLGLALCPQPARALDRVGSPLLIATSNHGNSGYPEPASPAREASQPATLVITWVNVNLLRVNWASPGWHCVRLDLYSVGCGYDSGVLLLPTGGVDYFYAPHTGQLVRLIDYGGIETARVLIPSRYHVYIPIT